MTPRRVLVAEPVGDEGLALLRAEPGFEVEAPAKLGPGELIARIGGFDALIVRSASKVTAEVLAQAARLQVVVRAGSGIDNIDVEAATARGIVVMNTPGGNTNAATEHTLALLLALARRIPAAQRSLAEGRWERERFVGFELMDRSIGVVGLGKIGSEVAARARAFRMEILGYDPFISRETAAARGIELLPLDDLLRRADVVTLHVPLADETKHLIGGRELALMKPGAVLINCARGGLIDEKALREALDAGHLGGAALDVFESEPAPDPALVRHPLVVATPHLGASTEEAKASVGIQAAKQVIGVLNGTSFENAINLPVRDASLLARYAPFLRLAERMGSFQAQVSRGGVREAALESAGEFEDTTPLRLAYLKGLLRPVGGASANYVNAEHIARERGIRLTESRSTPPAGYQRLLTATLRTDTGRASVSGTVLANDEPRFVEIDGFRIDAIPEGNLLVCRSLDRPGVIGEIGTCCGRHGLNISEFRLGRLTRGEQALSLLTLDSPASPEALAELASLPNVIHVQQVAL